MSQTLAGSYINLFSQKLLQAVFQSAVSNPLTAIPSPFIAQMDLGLAQNVQSLDAMLSSVGVGISSGFGGSPVVGGGFSMLM